MRELGSDFDLRIVANFRESDVAGYPPNMTFLGRVGEKGLVEEYQRCDALLFPSRWEGFGYTVLEAMACGKPVISTNASAIPEVVLNGETGILCNADDASAFATACRHLRATPSLCHSMGTAGRRRALDLFSESHLTEKYLDLIDRLLGNTR